MKTVEAIGLGQYQIVGEREEEAAEAFAALYAERCRSSGDGDSLLWELASLRREIIERYDVRITLV